MNRLIYFAGVAVLLAVAAWLATRDGQNPIQTGRLLSGFNPEKVARLEISQGAQKATLDLADAGWVVAEREGYRADSGRVLRLIRTFWELRPTQTLPATPEDWAKLGLSESAEKSPQNNTEADSAQPPDSPSEALIVRFFSKDNQRLAGVVLGKLYTPGARPGEFGSAPSGRYLRSEAAEKGAVLVSNTFFEVSASPESWLDREFLRLGEVSRISWTPSGANAPAWELVKQDGQWALQGQSKEQTNQDAARSVESSLQTWHFEDVSKQDFAPRGSLVVLAGEKEWELTIGEELSGKVPMRLALLSSKASGNSANPAEATADASPAKTPEPTPQPASQPGNVSSEEATANPDTPSESDTAANPTSNNDQAQTDHPPTSEPGQDAAKFQGWTYLMPSYVFQSVLVEREKLQAPPPPVEQSATTPPQNADAKPDQSSGATTAPVSAPSPRKKK